MKLLKVLALVFFFIHYYVAIVLIFLLNIVKYAWKIVAQISTDKHHVNPFTATHAHVFAPLHQLISHEGFVVDTHEFQTSDGATVCLWRIKLSDAQTVKPYPILMMHGLLDCSASWFLHVDKSKSLPYMLASEGYDVWIGNNRGNRVSMNQKKDTAQSWEYNLDHLVEYDQPALINKVLELTGKEKIVYIGHSQGSAQFLLGLGIHEKLQQKIAAFVGLGTVVSFRHVKSHFVLKMLSSFYLLQLCNLIGFKRILILPKILSRAVGVLIYNSGLHFEIIHRFIRLLCGFSVRNKVPKELFGVMITHEPGGSSANNALHWVQCYRSGAMQKFNFGYLKNVEVYGHHEPPTYCLQHLKNLPFKTYLFKGMKDAVMSDQDFIDLKSRFNPQKLETHEIADYNHLDYVWSETAHHDLYGSIIEIVKAHDLK